jgi:hypothetical protein
LSQGYIHTGTYQNQFRDCRDTIPKPYIRK